MRSELDCIADKNYILNLGLTKEDFHAMTWLTSWAVDADHGSDIFVVDSSPNLCLKYRMKLFVICLFPILFLHYGLSGGMGGVDAMVSFKTPTDPLLIQWG